VIGGVYFLPVLWIVLTAFKSPREALLPERVWAWRTVAAYAFSRWPLKGNDAYLFLQPATPA